MQTYRNYTKLHPDYSFGSTLEGLTNRSNSAALSKLFRFLDVPFTNKLRRVALSYLALHDWSEERHRRRMRRVDESGKLVVETRDYAFVRSAHSTKASRHLDALSKL